MSHTVPDWIPCHVRRARVPTRDRPQIAWLGKTAAVFLVLATGLLTATAASQSADAGSEQDGQPRPARAENGRTDALGDPLPPGAIARLGSIRWRHATLIASLAFSPDGKSIYSSCGNGRLSRWNATTGERLQDYRWSASPIRRLALSPDGKYLADRGTHYLHDTATAKALTQITEGFSTLTFSRDGQTLALGGYEGSVLLLEVPSFRKLGSLEGHEGEVLAVTYSPKGNLLASADTKGTICFWDPTSGKELARWRGHQGGVWSLAFSPDGSQLASVGSGEPIRLWDVTTKQLVAELARPKHRADGSKGGGWMDLPLIFSPDGKSMFWLNRMWDVATRKEVRQFGAALGYGPIALSPDGTVLAHAHGGRVRTWRVADGQELHPDPDAPQRFDEFALSPDGKIAASVVRDSASVLRLYDTSTGKVLRRVSPPDGTDYSGSQPAFTPDGRTLAVGCLDKSILLLATSTGKVVGRLRGHEGPAWAVVFSRDGRLLASEAEDGTARLWDLASGKEIRKFPIHGASTRPTTAFSHDGRLLATRSGDSSVAFWETATGKHLRQIEGPGGWSLAFSPDSTSLTVHTGNEVTFWDVTTGKEQFPFGPPPRALPGQEDAPHAQQLKFPTTATQAYSISPDGRTLAVGRHDVGTPNKMVCLYELATGKERLRLREHRGDITSIHFTADCRTLASASRDTTALIWDLTGRQGTATVPTEKERTAALDDLASDDAARAYQAVWTLASTPAETLAALRQRLVPAPAADPKHIEQLIADLDSANFAVRQRASEALEKLDHQAENALERALAGKPTLEKHLRLTRLMSRLRGPTAAPEAMRQVRAVEVADRIGTPEARRLLQAWAGGAAAARLTREAQLALRRASP